MTKLEVEIPDELYEQWMKHCKYFDTSLNSDLRMAIIIHLDSFDKNKKKYSKNEEEEN
jgi:hypothetical protein